MTGTQVARRGASAPERYTVVNQDGEEISPLQALQTLASPERLEMLAALHERVDAACVSLLTDADYEQKGDRTYWKKSAFRKLGRAFGIQTETVASEFEWVQGPDGLPMCVGYAKVRATASWGQQAEAEGHCTTREESFTRKVNNARVPNDSAMLVAEHRVCATAETRAKNRAIDDLLAIGRAEEVLSDEAQAERDEEQRNKALFDLTQHWKRLLVEHEVSEEEEAAFCEAFRAPGNSWEKWGVAERQVAIQHVRSKGRKVFVRAVEWKREHEAAADPAHEAAERAGAGEPAGDGCPDCGTVLEPGMKACPECGWLRDGPPPEAETEGERFERSLRRDPLGEEEEHGTDRGAPREEAAGEGRRPAPPLVQRKAELVAEISELAARAGQDPSYPSLLLTAVLSDRGVEAEDLPELRLADVADLEAVRDRLNAEVAGATE